MLGGAWLQRDLLEGGSGWVDASGVANFPSSDIEVSKGEVARKEGEGEHEGSESLVILDSAQLTHGRYKLILNLGLGEDCVFPKNLN